MDSSIHCWFVEMSSNNTSETVAREGGWRLATTFPATLALSFLHKGLGGEGEGEPGMWQKQATGCLFLSWSPFLGSCKGKPAGEPSLGRGPRKTPATRTHSPGLPGANGANGAGAGDPAALAGAFKRRGGEPAT